MTDMPIEIWAHENPDRSYTGEKILPHYHAYPDAAYSLGRDTKYIRASELAKAYEVITALADEADQLMTTCTSHEEHISWAQRKYVDVIKTAREQGK